MNNLTPNCDECMYYDGMMKCYAYGNAIILNAPSSTSYCSKFMRSDEPQEATTPKLETNNK